MASWLASRSWDCQWVVPKVRTYLEAHQYPETLGSTQVDDWIRKHYHLPAGICEDRFQHCISRGLRKYGYTRRSCRGKTWDREVQPSLLPSSPSEA